MENENNDYAHINIERYNQLIEKARRIDNLANDLSNILPNSFNMIMGTNYIIEPYTIETVKALIEYLKTNNII